MTKEFPQRSDSASRHRRASPVRSSLVHDHGLEDHRLRILLEIVLGVRDGGAEDGFKETGAFLARIPEKLGGIGHRHSTHHLGHDVGLLWSEPSGCVVSVHESEKLLGGCGSGFRSGCDSGFSLTHLASVDPKLRRPAELSQFVTHHLLRDVDGRELFAVVNREGESDELGWNVAVASPRFDDLLLLTLDHFHDLLQEFDINVGAFFEGACHGRLESGRGKDESNGDERDDDLNHGMWGKIVDDKEVYTIISFSS